MSYHVKFYGKSEGDIVGRNRGRGESTLNGKVSALFVCAVATTSAASRKRIVAISDLFILKQAPRLIPVMDQVSGSWMQNWRWRITCCDYRLSGNYGVAQTGEE